MVTKHKKFYNDKRGNKSKNITIKIQEMSREENKKKISKMDSK